MSWLSDHTVRHLREVAAWPDMTDTRYTIERPLGAGGMGTVYLAKDAVLDREVAVKVVNAAAAHPTLDQRMRTEASVLARLEHPGIVPIHDAGRLADGRVYYVMKVVRGDTLDGHLADTRDVNHVLRIFERICETVAFAHARGFVHRDLKPENIMVGAFGEVLVMDWGVAKVLAEPEPPGLAGGADAPPPDRGTTNPGTVMGTPGFMPPEQALGDVERIDQRTDVYALGAMLAGALVGRTPPPEPLGAHALLARRKELPKRLRSICAKCLARDPRDRYPHAGAIADDLARYRAGQAVMAHPETIVDRAVRLIVTYRTPILLVLAYLVMRVVVALTTG